MRAADTATLRLQRTHLLLCEWVFLLLMAMNQKAALIFLIATLLVMLPQVYSSQNSGSNAPLYGIASWYSQDDPGILKTTANMELFDDKELTCAVWGLPFGSILKVTNVANNESIVVRVNDRGPAPRLLRQGRIIDLTKNAFSCIADLDTGLIMVRVDVLHRP